MYVEVKSPSSGRQYVYLKRSVRVGKKIKHITVERYGELQKLELTYPGFVDKLTKMCQEGSDKLFLRKLISFENGIEQALHAEHDFVAKDVLPKQKQSADNESGTAEVNVSSVKSSDNPEQSAPVLLFSEARSRLTIAQQELVSFAFNTEHIPGELVEKGALHKDYADISYASDSAITDRESLISDGFIDAVVVAAGVGKRMGSAVPKQYLKLDDKCILEHTVLKLLVSPYVRRVIVVISPEDEYFKFTCLGDLNRVVTVPGGKERVDSVICGLKAVKTPWVMVHDAARPLVSLFDIEKLLYSVADGLNKGYQGGILVSKVADTLKEASKASLDTNEMPYVRKTVDRSKMYRAQTPQFFRVKDLIKAINEALKTHPEFITDEASAMELKGHKVMLVEGSPLNFKVTEPADLLLVKALMSYCAPNF